MKEIQLGIVGLGAGIHLLESFLQESRARVASLCDTNRELLSAVGKRVQIPSLYTDFKEMLRREKLDGVVIAAPNDLHAPFTLAALRAGCHVLCEKPPADTLEGAKKMGEMAGNTGRVVMINFNYRYNPHSIAIKEAVRRGILGEIYCVKAGWHRRMGVPSKNWFVQKKHSGGGALIDIGIHRLDLALWMLDFPKVLSVSSSCCRKVSASRRKMDVEDFATAYIRLENGSIVLLETSWASHSQKLENMFLHLFGTKGGAVQENEGEGYQFKACIFREEGNFAMNIHPKANLKNLPTVAGDFIDAVFGRRRMQYPTIGEGIEVMKVVEAIYRSSEKGREVRIPP